MEKLKRKYARLCLVFLAMTLIFVAMPVVMCDFLDLDAALWGRLGVGGAVICMVLIWYVRNCCLRCPHCGRGLAVPRWNAGERRYCSSCGEPFIFDDEPEAAEESYDS